MANAALDCLIGIVGYSPVLDAFPLGPRLMKGLEDRLLGQGRIAVENMTWGPIHIVQHFQDENGPRPRRLILIGAAPRTTRPGDVKGWRWAGGKIAEQALQERIYEAVTGIVDINNTLAIGEHFGIWPPEVFAIEIDMPAATFGDMVIAESEGLRGDAELTVSLGFSPATAIGRLINMCETIAAGDPTALQLDTKQAAPLAREDSFTRHQFVR